MTTPLPNPYPVPSGKIARGIAIVPPSKSIAHRALILAALAHGVSEIGPIPDGDDVKATVGCLTALGVEIERKRVQGLGLRDQGGRGRAKGQGSSAKEQSLEELRARVAGLGGRFPIPRAPLDCGDSGTTLRLLMGLCGAIEGRFTLDGSAQLRARPVGDMAEPLRVLGANVRYAEREGFPPVVVEGARWTGGRVTVPGETSSQFLSGLLIGAPLASRPVELEARDLVSAPYAEMTAGLMERFGAHVERPEPHLWRIHPGPYKDCNVVVEPDASGAAFFWAAAAVTGGEVTVAGTRRESLQGDAIFPALLARMGCTVEQALEGIRVSGPPLHGLDADVRETPDLVPPLAAVACFAPGPTTLSGVRHLRFKESDRLAVLMEGLGALGGTILLEEDRLAIYPIREPRPAVLDPHGDHRMAMAFAVIGLKIPDVQIKNPACVAKSFPGFFRSLESLLI